MLGGFDKRSGMFNIAAKYDGETWVEIESLLEYRFGHRSIVQGNAIYHIGGEFTQSLKIFRG